MFKELKFMGYHNVNIGSRVKTLGRNML